MKTIKAWIEIHESGGGKPTIWYKKTNKKEGQKAPGFGDYIYYFVIN